MKAFRLSALVLLYAAPMVAFAAHPLTTDDTGVQGRGNSQLELNADRAAERITHNANLSANATLTRGASDSLDMAINVPWQRVQSGGTDDDSRVSQYGLGDTSVTMKWRFYQQDKLSFALKPQLIFATGNDNKGLGSGRSQHGLTAIAAWGDRKLSLLGNVGYLYADNTHGNRKDISSASAAALFGIAPQWRLVGELGAQSNSDPTTNKYPAFVNVGLIYSPTEKLDLDVGYRHGLNKAASLYQFGGGLTVRW